MFAGMLKVFAFTHLFSFLSWNVAAVNLTYKFW
jgi:hypothetical protein